MKSLQLLFVTATLLIASSCNSGPTPEQQAKRDDSIAHIQEEKDMALFAKRGDSLFNAGKEAAMAELKYKEANEGRLKPFRQQLAAAQAQLNGAINQMAKIKEFEFGRTTKELDQQVARQESVIRSWQAQVKSLSDTLTKLEQAPPTPAQ